MLDKTKSFCYHVVSHVSYHHYIKQIVRQRQTTAVVFLFNPARKCGCAECAANMASGRVFFFKGWRAMTYEQMIKMFDEAKTKEELDESKAVAISKYAKTFVGIGLLELIYEAAIKRIGL